MTKKELLKIRKYAKKSTIWSDLLELIIFDEATIWFAENEYKTIFPKHINELTKAGIKVEYIERWLCFPCGVQNQHPMQA